MKPIIRLQQKTKETYFHLLLCNVMVEIDELTHKWVEDLFINEDNNFSEEMLTEDLRSNLDFLFSKGVWIIEMAESMGYNIDTTFFTWRYETYTTKKDGHRFFAFHKQYCSREHRLLTMDELKQRNQEMLNLTSYILEGAT